MWVLWQRQGIWRSVNSWLHLSCYPFPPHLLPCVPCVLDCWGSSAVSILCNALKRLRGAVLVLKVLMATHKVWKVLRTTMLQPLNENQVNHHKDALQYSWEALFLRKVMQKILLPLVLLFKHFFVQHCVISFAISYMIWQKQRWQPSPRKWN